MNNQVKQIYLGVLGLIIIILLVIVIFVSRAYREGSFVSDEDLIKSILESSQHSRQYAQRLHTRTENLQVKEIIQKYLDLADELEISLIPHI
jgi:predicted Holliday junction resolvase-like endonuclease